MNHLDSEDLKFKHAEASCSAGQPTYDPAVLLKLYLYGCQRGIRGSRKLEYVTRTNVEAFWSCQQAQPSYKRVADIRKDNSKALKAAQKRL